MNEGQENITYKGPKVGRSLMHSRNIQEIKWSREGLKTNFQDSSGKSVKEMGLPSVLGSH